MMTLEGARLEKKYDKMDCVGSKYFFGGRDWRAGGMGNGKADEETSGVECVFLRGGRDDRR